MITCVLCMSQLYIYVAMVTIGCVDACLLSLQLEQLCSSMVSHTCTCIYVRTSPCGPSGGGGRSVALVHFVLHTGMKGWP